MITCDICSQSFEKHKSFTNHRRWHNLPEFKKFQKSCVAKVSKSKMGSKNPMWMGDEVGYMGLHGYIKSHLPKTKLCQCCNLVAPYDLANISGEYKRELSDWEWLCRRCHMLKDGRMNNLKQFQEVA